MYPLAKAKQFERAPSTLRKDIERAFKPKDAATDGMA